MKIRRADRELIVAANVKLTAMNDPHVESLHYRIKCSDSVDFSKASPLNHEEPDFSVRIEHDHAKIVMKTHCPMPDLAREMVDPFLHDWELSALLEDKQARMEFRFNRAEVIDRRPEAGVVHVPSAQIYSTAYPPTIQTGRNRYPNPPVGLTLDSTVDRMLRRYQDYLDGRTFLGDVAYYCFTELQEAAGRGDIEKHFGIDQSVLQRLTGLTDAKGGKQARKAKGAQAEFTSEQRAWLEAAIPIMIRRAAEVACNPRAHRSKITMADVH